MNICVVLSSKCTSCAFHLVGKKLAAGRTHILLRGDRQVICLLTPFPDHTYPNSVYCGPIYRPFSHLEKILICQHREFLSLVVASGGQGLAHHRTWQLSSMLIHQFWVLTGRKLEEFLAIRKVEFVPFSQGWSQFLLIPWAPLCLNIRSRRVIWLNWLVQFHGLPASAYFYLTVLVIQGWHVVQI